MVTRFLLWPIVLLLGGACGANAFAADSSLRVAVRVMPTRPAPSTLERLPVPPDTQPITTGQFGGSYHFRGPTDTAAQFYRTRLPGAGFRLVRASRDDTEMVWEDDQARVELLFDAVIGGVPATRITVSVEAKAVAT